MAKLSARGRTEIWRVEKRIRTESGGQIVTTLAYMSDRTLLKNIKSIDPNGKLALNHGWKKYAKVKKDGDPNRVRTNLLLDGFVEVPTKR